MPIDPSDIPDQMKSKIDPKYRKGALRRLAPTASEVNAKVAHKHEKEIQDDVYSYLERNRWAFTWSPMNRKTRAKIGTPDFIGCTPSGKFFAVECKLQGNVLSEEQRRFLERVQESSGAWIVARSSQQALEFLKGLAE